MSYIGNKQFIDEEFDQEQKSKNHLIFFLDICSPNYFVTKIGRFRSLDRLFEVRRQE